MAVRPAISAAAADRGASSPWLRGLHNTGLILHALLSPAEKYEALSPLVSFLNSDPLKFGVDRQVNELPRQGDMTRAAGLD